MKYLFIIIACIAMLNLHAQTNLVKNPSFEQYISCPVGYSMVCDANYWSGIVDTSITADSALIYHGIYGTITHWDGNCIPYYCNVCVNDSVGGVSSTTIPRGTFYYHYPRTGNGMMLVNMYEDYSGAEIRMYLQGRLYNHLIAGRAYCVSFYVVNTDYSGDGCNHIGAYFDDGTIDTTHECGHARPEYLPQVVTDSIITDTTNWTRIQGSFIATGTEKFITIGNFSDNAHTTILPCNSHGAALHAAYLIDDVSVIASDALATAGPDEWMGAGDSTYIGVDSNGDGMPCYWYVLGSSTPIDSGGRIKVMPAVTTSYEVVMDLCGTITRDTVVVHVWPLGVNKVQGEEREVRLYPNPTTGNLTIEGAAGCSVVIYDMVGRVQNCNGMYSCRGSAGLTMTGLPLAGLTMTGIHTITCNKETIDISNLQTGIYIVEVVYEDGERIRRRMVKD